MISTYGLAIEDLGELDLIRRKLEVGNRLAQTPIEADDKWTEQLYELAGWGEPDGEKRKPNEYHMSANYKNGLIWGHRLTSNMNWGKITPTFHEDMVKLFAPERTSDKYFKSGVLNAVISALAVKKQSERSRGSHE